MIHNSSSTQTFDSAADTSSLYTLGVDGGGSKTLAIIVDEHGHECGRGLSGSANHHNVGVAAAITHISEAVTLALRQAQNTPSPGEPTPMDTPHPYRFHSAWFGLAGVDHPSDHALLSLHLQSFAHHVHLTNDAELVLGALPDTVGIALIAGTGSIALGHDASGSSARAGGWGNLIGDEGSGYDLGHRCLQAVTQAADGRAQSTALTDLLLHHWHLHDTSEIIRKVYQESDKSTIAALSSLVCTAASNNDPVAMNILADAAQALALAVLAVKRQLDHTPYTPLPNSSHMLSPSVGADLSRSHGIHDAVNLALSGGLLLHEPAFRAQVIATIQSMMPLGTIALVEEPALSGARGALTLFPT